MSGMGGIHLMSGPGLVNVQPFNRLVLYFFTSFNHEERHVLFVNLFRSIDRNGRMGGYDQNAQEEQNNGQYRPIRKKRYGNPDHNDRQEVKIPRKQKSVLN